MNNLDFKMKSIYHRNPETTLMLNGIQYTLYWTPHARERIISRLKSSLMLQNTYILDFINDLSNYDKNILKQNCEFTVRDFKTGLFAVGGGMATLPFLYDMADKTHWFTSAQLADMIAVSESTPGPIGVNMATYVGFTTAGFWGEY